MIQIENTPNPNAIKFLSEHVISEVGTKEFQKNKIKEIKNNFVKSLLNIDGVELILFSDNFLSVKKQDKANWENIKPSVISSLNDYFQNNKKPILAKEKKDNVIGIGHNQSVGSLILQFSTQTNQNTRASRLAEPTAKSGYLRARKGPLNTQKTNADPGHHEISAAAPRWQAHPFPISARLAQN